MKDSKSEPKKDSLWQKTQYANLVRYVPSGTYYARVRIKGKLKVRSLETPVLTTALLKLKDFEKEERQKAERTGGGELDAMTFGDALEIFAANGYRPETPKKRKDTVRLKPRALAYYDQRIKALKKEWPELEKTPVRNIKLVDLSRWSSAFLKAKSATAHNHTIGIFRQVFDIAVERGAIYSNPAKGLLRATEKPKKLILPSRDVFQKFVAEIASGGGGFSRHCADLVQFLAFGGFRKEEAAYVTWADCDFTQGKIRVLGNPETGTKGEDGRIRYVPMIGEMRQLLERLRAARVDEPDNSPVMMVNESQKAMDRAAKAIGMERITHHDLRHLFVTRCIESGIDIPTIARWVGHRDGGALLMRVYGHLLDDHSAAMAQRVSFAAKQPENVVAMREAI